MNHNLDVSGLKILVMGLGLHGGGVETARYLVGRGARVTCTDLRGEEALAPSLAALDGLDIRYVLGKHREEDFENADIIVKNPAVPADSKWIAGRNNIETDLSLFLRNTGNPVLAVTGSKGKSTVVSALGYLMKTSHPGVRVGGNITVSPLSFIDDLAPEDPVVLELSSWQLADIRGRGILKPAVSCVTNLMHDHQNRYASFADYEADKMVIFENAGPGDITVFPDDAFGRRWMNRSGGTSYLIRRRPAGDGEPQASWIDDRGRGWFGTGLEARQIIPEQLKVPGEPFRENLLFAATMALLYGCPDERILEAASGFPGVPYRMEMFLEAGGIRFYDDTAATIPDAAAAAVRAMDRPVVLIAGGTDKKLDYAPFTSSASIPRRIILLEGSATDAWKPLIEQAGGITEGPFADMESAVKAASAAARPGDAILLSPGATSFGMFNHEFHRGDVFKAACRSLAADLENRPGRK